MPIKAPSKLGRALATVLAAACCALGAEARADAPRSYAVVSKTSVETGLTSTPAVAAFSDGGYVLVTQQTNESGWNGFRLTMTSAAGLRSSVDFRPGVEVSNYSAIADENDDIVVAYTIYGHDEAQRGAWIAKFDRSGAVIFDRQIEKNTRVGYFVSPQVAQLVGGRYAVTYVDLTGEKRVKGRKRYFHSLMLVVCEPNGDVVSSGEASVPEDHVPNVGEHLTRDINKFALPNVTPLPSGGMVVAWQHEYRPEKGGKKANGIRLQAAFSEFDANGVRKGSVKYVVGPNSEIGRQPFSSAPLAVFSSANGRYATLMAVDYGGNFFFQARLRTMKLLVTDDAVGEFGATVARFGFRHSPSVVRTGDQRSVIFSQQDDKCFFQVLDYRSPESAASPTRLDNKIGKGKCASVRAALLANGDIVAVFSNRRPHRPTEFYETILTPAD